MKTILITGGSGKFGEIFIRQLLEREWSVVTVCRNVSKIEFVHPNLKCVEVDVTTEVGMRRVMGEMEADGIVISHLVNNARSSDTLRPDAAGIVSKSNFLAEFELGVCVAYQLAVQLANNPQHRLVNVVNIGSMYGLVAANPRLYKFDPMASPINYSVVKAALHHLTKELAVRFSTKNIRVNCIAYGGVEGRNAQDFVSRYSKLTPSKRMLHESELFGPLDFLLSENSSAVNGHILVADGGWSIW